MYLTVDTKDVVLAIIFLIGLMLFSKWKPKNVSGFNGVFNYLIDSRKMIASYVPDYFTDSVSYITDQPYESSKGLSFECKYNESIPWKISGTIHKEDTCNGKNAYFVHISAIRYIEA